MENTHFPSFQIVNYQKAGMCRPRKESLRLRLGHATMCRCLGHSFSTASLVLLDLSPDAPGALRYYVKYCIDSIAAEYKGRSVHQPEIDDMELTEAV